MELFDDITAPLHGGLTEIIKKQLVGVWFWLQPDANGQRSLSVGLGYSSPQAARYNRPAAAKSGLWPPRHPPGDNGWWVEAWGGISKRGD